MIHRTSSAFWKLYNRLPEPIRKNADKSFQLLKNDPRHPSLHFKPVGKHVTARVDLDHRAVGIPLPDGVLWFWIGPHDEYERLIG